MTSMTDDGIAFQVLGLIVAGVYEIRIHHKLLTVEDDTQAWNMEDVMTDKKNEGLDIDKRT